ncbi:MAG: hypothetical protein WBF08_06630, partial [Candidatus Bathyarchaeia archaeon]
MFENKTFTVKALILVLIILTSLKLGTIDDDFFVQAQIGLTSIENEVIDAPSESVYFVFPDHDANNPKPPGVGYAWLSDWTAIGFMYGMCSNMPQNIAPDTRTSLFSNANGAPIISDSCLVLFGGPIVNAPVNYYEKNKIAPLYWGSVGGIYYWYLADGTRLDET